MASFSGAMAMDFEEIPLAYDNPEESVKAGPSWGRSGWSSVCVGMDIRRGGL